MSIIKKVKKQINATISKYGILYGIIVLCFSPISLLLQSIVSFYYVKKGRTNKYVLFQSWPDFSDNCLILLEYFIQNNILMDYKFIWLVKNCKSYKKFYKGCEIYFVQRVKYGVASIKAIKALSTAKYIFSSHAVSFPSSKRIPSQLYVMLWHGCGYKAASELSFDWKFDKALVPGNLFVETKSKFWNTTKDKLIVMGYPRYDWLLYPTSKTQEKYAEIKGLFKKCILWMPTFRNSTRGDYKESVISEFPLIKCQSDWIELDRRCKELNILLLVKYHVSQKNYQIDFNTFSNIKHITERFFLDADIPKYEFIALTDGLISDYSSVAFDYLIVDKPIAYALDDYELYKQTRGFVFDNPLDYMPGHHLYNLKDLMVYLNDVASGNDAFYKQRFEVRKLAIYDSDCYCKELVNYLGIK